MSNQAKQLEMYEYWEDDFKDPRDQSPLDMVKEYQATTGQHPDASLYANLIEEEFDEWVVEWAMGPTPNQLKELSDLVYVIYGYANARGWNLDEAVRRVHDNNMGRMYHTDRCYFCGGTGTDQIGLTAEMSRVCSKCDGKGTLETIHRRQDGKIIKNKDYPKVNLEDLM